MTVEIDLAKIMRRIAAILRALPKFHGQVVIVVRNGRIDHLRTEQVEKLAEIE